MEGSVSPLQIIKHKETDLHHRIEEARRQAEVKVQAAHQEAEQAIAQADQEGEAEAKACYQRGIEEAQREAKALVTAAHEQAAALRSQTAARLDGLVEQIVRLVLPMDSASTSQKLREMPLDSNKYEGRSN